MLPIHIACSHNPYIVYRPYNITYTYPWYTRQAYTVANLLTKVKSPVYYEKVTFSATGNYVQTVFVCLTHCSS